MIRQPIVAFVGHVDHGKSSLLQYIAHINITKGEAGGITQIIKAYTVTIESIKKMCGPLLQQVKQITFPGLLFIDTPGHAAFTSLRKRGGNLADIAILVVDINEGVKPQTLEAIEILKTYKTPFIIALNKLDNIKGWKSHPEKALLQNVNTQQQQTQLELDQKLYEIVGVLYEQGLPAERFDRVDDFTKKIGMIPVSAKTGEGIPELLLILTGLTQKYLEQSLRTEVSGPGKGTILEIKDIKGFGTTLDIILHDGTIKVNDTIAIAGVNEPTITKIRGLQQTEGNKLITIKEANAASALRIIAPNIQDVAPGMPLRVANTNTEQIKEELQEEVEESLIETDNEGLLLKADSLGSLEALIHLLREKNITIKQASIGGITKKDVATAHAAKEPTNKVILAFNVEGESDDKIKIIRSNIIYKILEDYESWKEAELKNQETQELRDLPKPAKVYLLPHCVFRQSNPAIMGARIVLGTLKVGTPLMKDGEEITYIKEIQKEKENVTEAKVGDEVAIALPGVTVGRQIKEGDTLYTSLTEHQYLELKRVKSFLKPNEVEVLKEIADIKRKTNTLWGL